MLPLIAGGLMLGGAGMSALGNRQRDKATRKAMQKYQAALEGKYSEDRTGRLEEQGLLSDLGRQHQASVGEYIGNLSASQYPGTDDGFADAQAGALTDIQDLTQDGPDADYAYSGAPETQAQQRQGVLTGADNKRMAEAMLADWRTKQIDEREQNSGHRLAFADLMRQSRGASMRDRFSLARALRELDWQQKSATLQGEMDRAQNKGANMAMLGGLATQTGGMLGSYAATPGPASAAPAPSYVTL